MKDQSENTIDRRASLAELAATIGPHIRRLEAIEADVDGRIVVLARHAVDAEIALLAAMECELKGIRNG